MEGGDCLFSGATPTLLFDALLQAQPDVVVLALCGFSISRTAQEIRQAWSTAQIDQLRRQTSSRVFVMDGNYLFNRSGPRVVESAEVLLEALHPSLRGHFGHFGCPFLMTLDDALELGEGAETGSIKNRAPVQSEEANANNTTKVPDDMPVPSTSASEMGDERQLACLRSNDVATAFGYNSMANQSDASRFAHVLQTHDDFRK